MEAPDEQGGVQTRVLSSDKAGVGSKRPSNPPERGDVSVDSAGH